MDFNTQSPPYACSGFERQFQVIQPNLYKTRIFRAAFEYWRTGDTRRLETGFPGLFFRACEIAQRMAPYDRKQG